MGPVAACLARPMTSAGTLAARPIASIHSAVPSTPTGAEPTMGRPAVSNSRIDAV